MIRGGVLQSIAMRVTGHRSDSMFRRYDVASTDDKLEALRRAREYAETRKAIGESVTAFPTERAHEQAHAIENTWVSEGIWLGGRDLNPKGTANLRQNAPTDRNPDSKKPQ
jgi:hypothetical protein